jgi:hypothetical protein
MKKILIVLLFIALLPLLGLNQAAHANTVYASSFGFNASDATTCLQNAINSGASHVIVDNTGSTWFVTSTINLASNQTVTFEDGVIVEAKPGYFHGTTECLFYGNHDHDFTLEGQGTVVFKMQKADYDNPSLYTHGEWRHGINLTACNNVTISNITVTATGGDGLYLGGGSTSYCQHITVDNVILDDNYRQGISVISADDVTISNCTISNTSGTAPESGIDFEPNSNSQRLTNILVKNCSIKYNAGAGISLYTVPLDSSSIPVDITVEDCSFTSNRWGVYSNISRYGTNLPTGNITFDGCFFHHDHVVLENVLVGSVAHVFKDCTIDTRGEGATPAASPILLTTDYRTVTPHIGGISFNNSTVLQDSSNSPIGIALLQGSVNFQSTLSSQITGSLYTKVGSTKTAVNLPAFISQTQSAMEAMTPATYLDQNYSSTDANDISDDWRFYAGALSGQNVPSPSYNDSSWGYMDAGHSWTREGYPDYYGIAWYRKKITLSALASNQDGLLYFDGVGGKADVYVNGHKIGSHAAATTDTGWNSGFRLDATGYLVAGSNYIVVKVTTTSAQADRGLILPVNLVIATS